jgi:glycosyltransferase involved in cell wall biosynthesis
VQVSIVINNFNYARFLGEAIESALTQTHRDVEVIVVDDGSTDDSREVLAAYHGRIRALLQENRGQGGAFNAGFAATSGDVILFLDADDVLLPGAAAAAAAAAERVTDGNLSQIHWRLLDIDGHGKPSGETTPSEPLADGDLLDDLLSDGPLQWSSPPTSGNAWPRGYLVRVMPVPEAEFRLSADAYLMALAPLYGRLTAIEPAQARYRRHGSNHWGGSFDEVARANRELSRHLLPIVAEHAARRGLGVDLQRWERRNHDLNLAGSLEDLDGLIGRTTPFVLIDGQELGLDSTSGRQVIPFLERDGEYWGEPEDDAQAILELERLRADGARFVVLAWPGFWWVDHYAGFIAHVRGSYPCRLANHRLIVFELVSAA